MSEIITPEQPVELKPAENKPKFSWKRVGKVIVGILLLLAVILGLWVLVTAAPVKAEWDSVVLDERNQYMPCEQLPFYRQGMTAISNHQDMLDKVRAAGASSVTLVEVKCMTDSNFFFIKGDLIIDYKNRQARSAIEKLLGNDFFGIPYIGLQK